MKVKNLLIVFLLLVGCNVSENQNIPFEVGWGVADITPPIGFPRYGYPPVMSTGVKNSLYPEQAFLSLRRKLKISIWGVQPPLEQLRIHEAVPPSVSGEPWHLPVEIHAFRLDTQTAIVTMPGELFTEFGIDLKKRSPFPNTILIELADADIAYIPTVQAFKEGSYETINSRLMPGGGEEMINQAVKILEDLR